MKDYRDIPKWIRGILKSRAKIMKQGLSAPKHDELLDIHRPSISPAMKKHLNFVIFSIKTKLSSYHED